MKYTKQKVKRQADLEQHRDNRVSEYENKNMNNYYEQAVKSDLLPLTSWVFLGATRLLGQHTGHHS